MKYAWKQNITEVKCKYQRYAAHNVMTDKHNENSNDNNAIQQYKNMIIPM